MKDTAFLVNMARGSIIVEAELYRALKEGWIAGFGADVWFVYPSGKDRWTKTMPSRYPIHELDNVVMSPHRSYLIPEREVFRLGEMAGELNRIAEGEDPRNIVDKSRGY